MSNTVESRLQALGYELPAPPRPAGSYIPAVRSGQLVFTAGQLPIKSGQLAQIGKAGGEVSVEAASEAAVICALNALAAIKAEIGSLDHISRIVRLSGYIASMEGFNRQAEVMNRASELIGELFGERGRHARIALGVSELPLGATVELEMVAEVAN